MLSQEEIKKMVGAAAIDLVQPGMTLGVGTGSTVYWFIMALAEKVKNGLECKAVPTSKQTEALARQHNIPLVQLNDVEHIALTIDGADEIAPGLQLIKGGGGALLQEKMVAAASERLVIIGDHTKVVPQLGWFPLPVEVVPYGWKQVARHIHALCNIEIILRMKDGQPFVTDHGHYILDCHWGRIADAPALGLLLNSIPGVVENGLFIQMAQLALVGYPDGRLDPITA
ncbi:MAG TPA: ribose-5-phosphate isomerase RpiA [Chitinophagaceae bacterium]|nr:ribose-5-phosphate isomerase RpiA [Chitinophagaceae bacterium]